MIVAFVLMVVKGNKRPLFPPCFLLLTIVEFVQGVFQEQESVAAKLVFPSCDFLHLEFLPQFVV